MIFKNNIYRISCHLVQNKTDGKAKQYDTGRCKYAIYEVTCKYLRHRLIKWHTDTFSQKKNKKTGTQTSVQPLYATGLEIKKNKEQTSGHQHNKWRLITQDTAFCRNRSL